MNNWIEKSERKFINEDTKTKVYIVDNGNFGWIVYVNKPRFTETSIIYDDDEKAYSFASKKGAMGFATRYMRSH